MRKAGRQKSADSIRSLGGSSIRVTTSGRHKVNRLAKDDGIGAGKEVELLAEKELASRGLPVAVALPDIEARITQSAMRSEVSSVIREEIGNLTNRLSADFSTRLSLALQGKLLLDDDLVTLRGGNEIPASTLSFFKRVATEAFMVINKPIDTHKWEADWECAIKIVWGRLAEKALPSSTADRKPETE